MATYMLLVRDDMEKYGEFSKSELQALIERMNTWSRSLREAGIHRGGEKLGNDAGRRLRKEGKGPVTDGPFAESHELVGGFFLIEAKNYDEAVRIASECPCLLAGASQIEVRVTDDCVSVLDRASDA